VPDVPLSLSFLARVEGPGFRRATQAGESRLVEDPFEDLIAPAHPAVVAGVVGGGHYSGVGGEPIGAIEITSRAPRKSSDSF
jgi:hypothetical protein